MMLSFSIIVALMPVMVLSNGDLTHDLKTRIDDAEQLMTEANSFLPELQEGDAAGKNKVTSEIKTKAEKLDTVTKELTSRMEQLPEDKKKEAMKGLRNALSNFKKPLKQFIKKVQKKLTYNDKEAHNNDAADDNDSCPDPNVLSSMLKEQTDKARQQMRELNTTVARRKRYASRKLKIKRALSYTIGLPVHIVFYILCLVNIPIGKTGFFLTGWLVFPWFMRFVSFVIMGISYVIEWVVIPKEDMDRFEEAMDNYAKFITETHIKIMCIIG